MTLFWAKTTILGCFFNKNAMKWYFKKIASDAWISTLWSILRGHVIISILKWKNGHISAQGLKMNKRRPLSFLQLQKFEKTKWACFIHFWPLGRDMAIFSFFPQFNSCPFFLRHPLPLLTPLSAQPPKCVTLKLIKNSTYLLCRACLVEMAIKR